MDKFDVMDVNEKQRTQIDLMAAEIAKLKNREGRLRDALAYAHDRLSNCSEYHGVPSIQFHIIEDALEYKWEGE